MWLLVSFEGAAVPSTCSLDGQRTNGDSQSANITSLEPVLRNLLTSTLAPASTQAYKRAWSIYRNFANKFDMSNDLPLSQETLALFISYLFAEGYAASSIVSFISSIAYIHKINNLPDNTSCFLIQKLLSSCRKSRPSMDIRLPITIVVLPKICDALEHTISNIYKRALFQTMFLLAFHGFLRIGEITSVGTANKVLQVSQITFQKSKVLIHFQNYKHSDGKVFTLTINSCNSLKYCPVGALEHYIKMRGRTDGPLFCYPQNTAVTRQEFSNILKQSLMFCNLDVNRFKGHSFRIGMASYCASRGMSDSQIRFLGRWKSDAFKYYIRHVTPCWYMLEWKWILGADLFCYLCRISTLKWFSRVLTYGGICLSLIQNNSA